MKCKIWTPKHLWKMYLKKYREQEKELFKELWKNKKQPEYDLKYLKDKELGDFILDVIYSCNDYPQKKDTIFTFETGEKGIFLIRQGLELFLNKVSGTPIFKNFKQPKKIKEEEEQFITFQLPVGLIVKIIILENESTILRFRGITRNPFIKDENN